MLDGLDLPADLVRLSEAECAELAAEIRALLIDSVGRSGGHLGSNLGVVELTIALHRVFASPDEPILFDVGHQSYVHKILTGRAASLATLRSRGGMSGYPSRAESAHDVLESSHASTALSWGAGVVRASGRPAAVVVGDGALGGGTTAEALTMIGADRARFAGLVLVVNDNGLSYSATVGAPVPQRLAGFGLPCSGPVDGHDLSALDEALADAREAAADSAVAVWVRTEKGRGIDDPASSDDRFHSVPPSAEAASAESFTSAFSAAVLDLASSRPDLIAVTAAMTGPTGLSPLAAAHPERVVDVGIAEGHALAMAAGLARGGAHPLVCLYSTFLTRALDQLLVDVALHREPVTVVCDRAGVTGPDGPSHHGLLDLAFAARVPGLRVAAPRDRVELAEQLAAAVAVDDGPTLLRFPRAAGDRVEAITRLPGGIDVIAGDLREAEVLIVCVGACAQIAAAAAQALSEAGIAAAVVDPRWALPVSSEIADLVSRSPLTVVVEDGVRTGGVGTAVADACADSEVIRIGAESALLAHGTREEMLAEAGVSSEAIVASVLARLG